MKEVLLTSSALILALLCLRAVFRRSLSRRVQYALWGLVLARLLIPVNLPAVDFSVLTAAEPVGQSVSALLDSQRVYVPVDRAPLAEHPAAPDIPPANAMAPASSSVWVVEDGETAVRYQSLTAAEVLRLVWLGGLAVTALCFGAANLRFWRKLCKGRTPYTVDDCRYPVYLVAEGLPSPCLFGLLRPAIYLTPAAAETQESLRHVIAHESTHARQGDPLWSFLRCVCLAVYWFDPLVWAAAAASRADCELSCDEGALKALGEAERIAYGKTLLSLIPVRRGPANPLLSATTMTAGKRHLKDRITRIAENRQTRAAALFAAAALALGACAVTFTGAKEARPQPLTGDELAYFNEAFFNNDTVDHTVGVNIHNQFLTSLYTSPAEIDLFELFYCGTGLAETMSDNEWQQVGSFDENGELVFDTDKLSIAAMDQVLLANAGLTLEETQKIGLEQFQYLPEYESYYHSHGDTNYFHSVQIAAGEREGDTIRLYYPDSFARYSDADWLCVTLETRKDGSYWFVSNLPCEKPAVPTVYPEGEAALTLPLKGLASYEPQAMPVERRTNDCADQGGGFGLGDGTRVRTYLSTDGNLYAALIYEATAGRDGMAEWDVGTFFTFPEGNSIQYGSATISCFFFSDLFGQNGLILSYDGQISENHFGTVNDYYIFHENAAPRLLARAYGTAEIIDLDGDGENELCASSGSTAQVFFQRDEEIYEADVGALLKAAWPEAKYLNFGNWDVSRRKLSMWAAVPFAGHEASGASATAFRDLYFNGESLLLYRDGTVYADHLAEGIDAPEAVLAAARDFVLADYAAGEEGYELVDGAFQSSPPRVDYDDWRITELEGPFRETVGGLTLDVWRLGYELHTATPERVVQAGGRYATEDGWISQGYPGCDYLYFTVNTGSGPAYLFSIMENDCIPGTEQFFTDMAFRLLELDFLAPSDLDGRALLTMLSPQPVSFLNRLAGEWPLEEAYAALATLGRYLAYDSSYDEQTAYADCARYVDRFGEDLTAEGRVAWNWLQALAAGAGSAGPSPAAADLRTSAPPEVLSAALAAAEVDYSAFRAYDYTDSAGYDGWRLAALDPVTGYAPFPSVPVEIYRMSWQAHASRPEGVSLAGGMEMDGDNWVSGINSGPYLVFLRQDGKCILLSRNIASDVSPEAPFFRADLATILLEQGLVTPEDIGPRTLLSMFYGGNVNFLNRMGALPQNQQADTVEALASFHHQGLFEEEGELRDAIQHTVWSQRDLDAGGAALLHALLERTGIQAFGIGDSYGDLDAAIHQALLDRRQNASAHKDDFYAVSHRVLDTVRSGCTDTVYLLTCFGSYDAGRSGGYTLQTNGVTPAALTFARVNGLYQLTEYWEPAAGADYAEELAACFPPEAAEAALDPEEAILETLQTRMEQDAAQHFAKAAP